MDNRPEVFTKYFIPAQRDCALSASGEALQMSVANTKEDYVKC